ncbi:MAG: putative Ig domain-containing protein [Acidimicrobiales bacterium]
MVLASLAAIDSAGAAPPSALTLSPTSVTGGSSSTATVTLNADAPSGGTVVTLTDNSAATTVPATVTVTAGNRTRSFTVTTTAVTAVTTSTITASADGVSQNAVLTVNPPRPGTPSTVAPANDATVAQPITFDWTDVANAVGYEIQIDNSSTIAAPYVFSQAVSSSQTSISGLPAQRLWWRVRAQNSAGQYGSYSSTRRFTALAPPTAASLSSVTVAPTSVDGGSPATGTISLSSAAPSGGAAVTLASSNSSVASVPASVTVPAGATSATFPLTTTTVSAQTAVTITATAGSVTLTATITINPEAAVVITADGPLGPGFVGSDFVTYATLGTVIALGGPAVGPVEFGVTAGQLPAGLRLEDVNTSGTPAKHTWVSVVGVPTSVGTSSFSVTLTDANGVSRTGTYTITVNPALTLVINLQEPWTPVVGTFSNLWIDATGGSRPYRWAVTGGALPPGMSLVQDNPDGPLVRITGTPTAAGAFTFTLRLTDATGATVSRVITVTVG